MSWGGGIETFSAFSPSLGGNTDADGVTEAVTGPLATVSVGSNNGGQYGLAYIKYLRLRTTRLTNQQLADFAQAA